MGKKDRELLEYTKEDRDYLEWCFGEMVVPDPNHPGFYQDLRDVLSID